MTFKLRNPACLIIFLLQIVVWFGMFLGSVVLDPALSLLLFSLVHLKLWGAMGLAFLFSLADWKTAPWVVARDFSLFALGNGVTLLFYVVLFWELAEEGSF